MIRARVYDSFVRYFLAARAGFSLQVRPPTPPNPRPAHRVYPALAGGFSLQSLAECVLNCKSVIHSRPCPSLFLIFLFLLMSCGKPIPVLDRFNITEWKNDKNGCAGKRILNRESIIQQKEKLLSLTETDLVRLIGKPDETELYKRSEKFYKYYFSNGPGCPKDSIASSALIVRFNAMGLAKEVVVE